MIGLLTSIAGAVLPRIFGTIDKAVADKDLRERLKHEVRMSVMSIEADELKAARDIIVAEARGESWLQRSWRPLVMLMFAAIIANNFIVVPYLTLFNLPNVYLDLPVDVWQIIKIGLGGYVVGRSAEKVAREWKGRGNG